MVQEKIKFLTELEGFTDEIEMMQEFIMDSLAPAICMNPDCNYTAHYEHDSREGWCENCNTNTVASIYVLMGVI